MDENSFGMSAQHSRKAIPSKTLTERPSHFQKSIILDHFGYKLYYYSVIKDYSLTGFIDLVLEKVALSGKIVQGMRHMLSWGEPSRKLLTQKNNKHIFSAGRQN